MPKTTLFFIILIEGFITIAIEILSIRQMVPFVGSNILNTSIIIGIFLLSLSIGYYRGGMVSENYQRILLSNLIKTFFFISFGLSYTFLSFLFSAFESLAGLLIFSLFIMAPTIFYLGQTIPILTNLIKNERNGKISGQLLFLSTFGSFLGSIVTSVVLLNYVGVNTTIMIVVFMLGLLITALAWQNKERFISSIFIVAGLLPVVVLANSNYGFIKANNYSNIAVVQDDATKYLIINDSMSSSYDNKTKRPKFDFAKKMQSYIQSLNREIPQNILILGAGGFIISLGDTRNKYTYVDIDKDLKEVSEEHLLGGKINGRFIVEDGRHFLSRSKERFDVIIVDVFSNKTSIPSSFVTADFYAKASKSLSKNGVLIVNTISKPLFRDKYSRKLNHSILQSFDCQVSLVDDNLVEHQNIIYACSAKNTQESPQLYTDNLTNLLDLASGK